MKQKKISDKYLEKRVVTAAGRKDNFLVGTYTVFTRPARVACTLVLSCMNSTMARLAVLFNLFGQGKEF